jgi:serpin B
MCGSALVPRGPQGDDARAPEDTVIPSLLPLIAGFAACHEPSDEPCLDCDTAVDADTDTDTDTDADGDTDSDPCADAEGTVPRADVTPDMAAVVAGNSAFAWDLYGELRGGEGNLFVSPFSVSAALALVYAGAGGTTHDEMASVLHVELDDDAWHTAFAALLADFAASGGAEDDECLHWTMQTANALFGDERIEFEEPFLTRLADTYGVPMNPEDFHGNPEMARQDVNAWVADHTAGRIAELFQDGQITPDTVFIAANAVYFLGKWESAFPVEDTADGAFTRPDGSPVTAPFMHQVAKLRYAWLGDASILELPYRGRDLAMDLVLPPTDDGLPAIEAGLDAARLDGWLSALSETDVDVTLPRLQYSARAELPATLAALGMPAAFDPYQADFSPISAEAAAMDVPLHLDDVVHEAWISVDEAGTEAAAATGVEGTAGDSAAEIAEFHADHPFLFLIRDTHTGSLLFVGRVVDPTPSPAP